MSAPNLQGVITITRDRLYDLLDTENKFRALECGGVDNWDWYGDSIEDHYEPPTNEDLDNEAIER